MMMSPTPSGQPADVGDDSERRGGPDGLRSAPHSNGRLGGHWLGPDSKHTAVEVSLRSSQSSGPARDEATGGANYTLCCTRLWWGWKLVPAPITDQPSEHETCISLYFFFLFPLSVSLSLYCVSESGVIQDHSLAVSAYHMVFLDHNFLFSFFGKKWKQHCNYKEITPPSKVTKLISTYQKSCRTSYTSFYCITVSL